MKIINKICFSIMTPPLPKFRCCCQSMFGTTIVGSKYVWDKKFGFKIRLGQQFWVQNMFFRGYGEVRTPFGVRNIL